jgi:hypothetical protein
MKGPSVLEARPKSNKERRQRPVLKFSGKVPLYLMFLAAAGLLVAGGIAFRHSRPNQESQRTQLIRAGQALVRANLAEGLRSFFGGEEETVVESLPDNKFLISGWVDLLTNAGQQDRQNYSLIIFKDDTGNWSTDRVSVIPQM